MSSSSPSRLQPAGWRAAAPPPSAAAAAAAALALVIIVAVGCCRLHRRSRSSPTSSASSTLGSRGRRPGRRVWWWCAPARSRSKRRISSRRASRRSGAAQQTTTTSTTSSRRASRPRVKRTLETSFFPLLPRGCSPGGTLVLGARCLNIDWFCVILGPWEPGSVSSASPVRSRACRPSQADNRFTKSKERERDQSSCPKIPNIGALLS